jgi:hypothetical protein
VKLVFAIGLLSGVLLAGASHAWVDRDGTLLPNAEYRMNTGAFSAWLLLVDDEEEFFRRWEALSPVANIETADRIERGQFITAFVIFGGCAKDSVGRCDVAVDFRIKNPDGTDYVFIPNQRAWDNYSGPEPGILVLSRAYLKIRIEPDEFLGEYRVEATLRDVNADRSILLGSAFVAYDPTQ